MRILSWIVLLLFIYPIIRTPIVVASAIKNWRKHRLLNDPIGLLGKDLRVQQAMDLKIKAHNKKNGSLLKSEKPSIGIDILCIFLVAWNLIVLGYSTYTAVYLVDIVVFGMPFFHYAYVKRNVHSTLWFLWQGNRWSIAKQFYLQCIEHGLLEEFVVNVPMALVAFL